MKNKIIANYLLIFPIIFLSFGFCNSGEKTKETKSDYLQIQRRRLLKTKTDMREIGDAIMQFIINKGNAPEIEEISELKDLDFPEFRRLGNLIDEWGNDYLYKVDEDDESTFYLASKGRDGKFDGWEQRGRYTIIELKEYDKDLIFSNGGFIYTSN